MLFWLIPLVYVVIGAVAGKIYFNQEAKKNRKHIGESTTSKWDGYHEEKTDAYDRLMKDARVEAFLISIFWGPGVIITGIAKVFTWVFGSKQHKLNKLTQNELNELKAIKKRTDAQDRRLQDIEMELGKC